MLRRNVGIGVFLFVLCACGDDGEGGGGAGPPLRLSVGVAVVPITPCGVNPAWDGPITSSGVWGEEFTDQNANGRYDAGEPYVDDPLNGQLDPSSIEKYDGVYLAGFGNDRIALGCHDDLWARALVLATPSRKVAFVSVDVVGLVVHGSYYGFRFARDRVDPALGVDTIIFSSTHNHEGPDTLGLWGETEFTDGKFPRYLRFVDAQVARAIELAASPAALRPARVVAARTDSVETPSLRGLQVRTGCRPPFFVNDELLALRFVETGGATIATLINWSTHPESLESENTLVTSDFPHYIRARVERQLGGTAVYFSGDLGAVEIVGDSCVGGADPRAPDGTNEFDRRDEIGFPRTERIGHIVGDAVVSMLQRGSVTEISDVEVASASYRVAGSNAALSFANTIGLLDLDMEAFSLANCPDGTGVCVPVEQHVVTLRDRAGAPLAQLVTAPGEIFPELVFGVERIHRTDCPHAHTGLPYEPSIRDAMSAPFRFLIGLSPDELGYIVPGYDFHPPTAPFEGARDPCQGMRYDPNIARRTVPSHYHETLSIGADIAVASTCRAVELLGRSDIAAQNAACRGLTTY